MSTNIFSDGWLPLRVRILWTLYLDVTDLKILNLGSQGKESGDSEENDSEEEIPILYHLLNRNEHSARNLSQVSFSFRSRQLFKMALNLSQS